MSPGIKDMKDSAYADDPYVQWLRTEMEAKGLDPDFRQRVRGALVPGTSMVLFVIASAGCGAPTAAVSQLGGTVLRRSLEDLGLSGRGPEHALTN